MIKKKATKAAKTAKAAKKWVYKRKATLPAAPTPKANKLELLLKSITEQYGTDPSAPGIALSALAAGKFYVAIRRFRGYAGKEPQVIISTTADSLLQGMNEITGAWRKHIERLKFSATEQFLKLGDADCGHSSDDDIPF